MTDQWYIARDGQTFGPYSPDQVRELSRIQPLLPTDQMLRAGTQEWRPALPIEDLFAAPAPLPEPEPEPAPEYRPEPEPASFDEGGSPSPARARRKAGSAERLPLWFWLGPTGGAAFLGLLTVGIMMTGRSKPAPPPPKAERRPTSPLRPPPIERPTTPRVETPLAPPDYSVQKVDYTKGFGGEKVRLVADTPRLRREGFVNARGKTVFLGKTEESYPDGKKKSEVWYSEGLEHGPATAWDEAGRKTSEGQYSHGAKQGKWTAFRADGRVASEEMWFRGKRHGPSTTFHANGKKAQTVEYRNDRRTPTPATAWDEAGKEATADESLHADLKKVDYDEMNDVLGQPTEVHEAPRAKGALHIWARPDDRFIAVWVTQGRGGVPAKGDVRAFLVTRDAIDKLKRETR